MVKNYVEGYLKDSSFNDLNRYWITIRDKGDLDESKEPFKSKDCEKFDEISW